MAAHSLFPTPPLPGPPLVLTLSLSAFVSWSYEAGQFCAAAIEMLRTVTEMAARTERKIAIMVPLSTASRPRCRPKRDQRQPEDKNADRHLGRDKLDQRQGAGPDQRPAENRQADCRNRDSVNNRPPEPDISIRRDRAVRRPGRGNEGRKRLSGHVPLVAPAMSRERKRGAAAPVCALKTRGKIVSSGKN